MESLASAPNAEWLISVSHIPLRSPSLRQASSFPWMINSRPESALSIPKVDFPLIDTPVCVPYTKKPKFIHPLRCGGIEFRKTQLQFARDLGISPSISRPTSKMVNGNFPTIWPTRSAPVGIDADSLKRRGKPRSVIGSTKAAYTISSVDAETWKTPTGLENISDEYRGGDDHDPNGKLRRSIPLWQKITPHWNLDIASALLTTSWRCYLKQPTETKILSLGLQLSRWIDNAVSDYRLRTTIDDLRKSHTRGRRGVASVHGHTPRFQINKTAAAAAAQTLGRCRHRNDFPGARSSSAECSRRFSRPAHWRPCGSAGRSSRRPRGPC